MSVVEISKQDALGAVRGAAWAEQVTTCGHTGCTDHVGDGQRYIHVLSLTFGLDMPLESVEEEICTALRVGWSDHLFHHDLVAEFADARVHHYDVKRPAGVDR